jgi:hypothetical protein
LGRIYLLEIFFLLLPFFILLVLHIPDRTRWECEEDDKRPGKLADLDVAIAT